MLCIIIIVHRLGAKNDVFESRRRLVENLTADATTKRQILPVLNEKSHVEIQLGISLRQISTVVSTESIGCMNTIYGMHMYYLPNASGRVVSDIQT